jgi:hypothetical protein
MGMKCIRCGTDNNLRERTNNQGRCKNCSHLFAFEPAIMNEVKFTDGFFAKAINDISANETLYFTPKQLSYLLCKRINKKKAPFSPGFPVISGIFLLSLIIAVIYDNKASLLTVVVFGGIVLVVLLPNELKFIKNRNELILNKSSNFFLTQEQFQDWINSWLRVNQIPKMLPSNSEESASTPVSSDISTYSFDRAVICESAAIAQVLIANNFHFENNCAVLSITGYPQSIFGTVMLMLRRNPELKVYAIHDASPSGVALVHHLRTSLDWFANSNVTIYELGLLPRQIFSKPNLFVQTSQESAQQAKQLPEQVRQSLSSDELKWLEKGKFLELESFSPQRIIQILNQGIARSQDSTATVDSFG